MKRSEIILSLIGVVKAKLPGIVFIDINRGQLNSPESSYPFPKPAILLHLGQREWEVTGKGMQKAKDAEIKATIIQDNYSQTFDGAVNQEQAMRDVLDFPEQVYLALQSASGSGFSGLNRVDESETLFDGVIIVDEITFHTTIEDSAIYDSTIRTVDLDLNIIK